ncbi:uncharacterized protein LOC107370395 [Tetranychus urticae]|uniref:Intradiol ring-cleavage dioxygenases domain-containing protein n=1 Tax=Tetranychus urticae TaxID=32264 RepID=T1L5A9_TETUR|nr:uncharacterized protein LOC107370395 [Tetranychus urticae]
MLVQVIIVLICHLVEPRPIDDNKLDEAKSQFLDENKSSYICELSPFSDEGHYFLPNDPERSNITDGEPGIKLHLIIRLINARTCEPLKGVYVHIWHANAKGEYSGIDSSHQKSGILFNNGRKSRSLNIVGEKETDDSFDESRVYQKTRDTRTKLTPELNNPPNYASNPENLNSNSKLNLIKRSAAPASMKSQNFLRGYQISNYAGEVSFATIIPGWYKGRAQHIHIEVYPDKSTSKPMYIGQLFFNKLYHLTERKEYESKNKLASRDDGIYKHFEGDRTTISMADIGPNMQGIITLGVDPEMTKIFD